MKFKLVLINGYFGQRLPTSRSMDVDEIIKFFHYFGHVCEKMDVHELANGLVDENYIYLISSHQNPGIKKYLNDIVVLKFLDKQSNVLPSIKNFVAHENKGAQAIISAGWADSFVQQAYYYDEVTTQFPKVAKKPSGSGSVGVSLVKDKDALRSSLKKMFLLDYNLDDLIFMVKELIKHTLLRKKLSAEHTLYFKKYNPYILQDYIPNLTGDFKVLVFGKKVYVLTREVRKNDFRASGSGLFSFKEPSTELLNFALSVKNKLKTPMVSLDIVSDNGIYKCIEYQCTHFGPYAQFEAKYYYEYTQGAQWIKKDNDVTIEYLFAEAVDDYLKDHD
ncbi:hypothetical protein C7M52_00934 [Mixta theicola]|nr:hypothetical protein [Mixta theicola]QHM74990.1 hypothetical protein C7M52_00934 [Mixta theicola]